MRSSYREEDVLFLLKDITGLVAPQPTEERERLIQSGRHYCEMLPVEYAPSEKYLQTYRQALADYARATARAVGLLAEKILKARGSGVVLVSLARAGTPVGILLRRYFIYRYQLDIPHYSISIIRGRGIDQNAIRFLLDKHAAQDLLFVDGWIGKGAILEELRKSVSHFPGVSAELAVLADPAHVTHLCGTHQDILIPSSCLNSTVSGLVSRTFLRDDIIGPDDFHGALYYEALREQDLSYAFIDAICERFEQNPPPDTFAPPSSGLEEVTRIAKAFSVDNIHFIKPGIGETTRVLLRRVPWKVLVSEKYKEDASLSPIFRLAKEKNVPVSFFPLENYKACGIIRNLADA